VPAQRPREVGLRDGSERGQRRDDILKTAVIQTPGLRTPGERLFFAPSLRRGQTPAVVGVTGAGFEWRGGGGVRWGFRASWKRGLVRAESTFRSAFLGVIVWQRRRFRAMPVACCTAWRSLNLDDRGTTQVRPLPVCFAAISIKMPTRACQWCRAVFNAAP
jgi:hypothetical protein